MTRIMAQGTFDLLHPGHLHYLRASAALGDELFVVIARDSRMEGERTPVMPEDARREMVDALEMVDRAVLGSEASIFDSVERLSPDVITLGHDQDHDVEELLDSLERHGFGGIEVVRVGGYEGEIASSTEIRQRLDS